MASLDLAYEEERTKRMFIQTLGSAFGVEQSFAETDSQVTNWPGQYAVYGNTYGYAKEGQAVSQASQQGVMPLLIVVGLGLVLWRFAR